MKKIILSVFVLLGLLFFVSCQSSKQDEIDFTKSEGSMTYQEFKNAKEDTEVTIEAFVQAKQSWWSDNGQGKASLYLADNEGAYFVYDLPITETDYSKLTIGKKVKITGIKGSWSGEVEILGSQAGAEATYKILDGTYVAEPKELSLNSSESLNQYINQKVSFKNLTIVAQEDGTSSFYYKYNNSGERGDDLYYIVTDGTYTYTFVVESYLCDKDSDVYKAVENLNIGDIIQVEGFLYWYNAPQLHTTKITK